MDMASLTIADTSAKIAAITRYTTLVQSRRTSASAKCVRQTLLTWVRDDKFVLRGKGDAVTIARAHAAVRVAIPTMLAKHEAFGAARVRAKEARGKVCGLYELKLVAHTPEEMLLGRTRLTTAGFTPLVTEEEFGEEECCTILVPKDACIGGLIQELVNLAGVTKLAYSVGGGLPGAGIDKVRLCINGTPEMLVKADPKLARLDDGVVSVYPLAAAAVAEATETGGLGSGLTTSARYMVVPGRASSRRGSLKIGVLAIGVERDDNREGRPLRQFFAEAFSSAEDDVRFFSLHDKGFSDGAYEVSVPDTPENREQKALLVAMCAEGTWTPEAGDVLMCYHDPCPPAFLFAVDRMKLVSVCREFAPEYLAEKEHVGEAHRQAIESLAAQVGMVAENAAADRSALTAGQALLRSELSAQAKAQTAALSAQTKACEQHGRETAETVSALQAQTDGMQTIIEQQRDMVAAAHARVDDGRRSADAIADTLAQLMLQNNRMMQRIAGSESAPSRLALAFDTTEDEE